MIALNKKGYTHKIIAPLFGVSAHQIGVVIKGKNWGYVEDNYAN